MYCRHLAERPCFLIRGQLLNPKEMH